MIQILSQDYIRTARAMGIPERTIIFKYALKNALVPVVTISMVNLGIMLIGAVFAETIFTWPGIGSYLVDSIHSLDYPSIRGAILILAVAFVFLNILAESLCAFVDPRVRMGRNE